MVFNNNLLLGAAGQGGGAAPFDPTLIGNSVWLDGSADFLSAELGAKTRTKAVIGTWIQKTGFTTADATIFSKKGAIGVSGSFAIRMQDQSGKAGKISIFDYDGSNFQYSAESTSMLLRDIGWYHIMLSIDTTADAGSRLKYYINGIDQTSTLTVSTDYTANDNPSITGGSGQPTQWGVGTGGASQFNPCYLAQSFMLDDDSIQNGDVAVTDILDTFTFGTNGSQYVPKADADIAALATTAGGDSFCLDFADSADLGNDISSNANDFTANSMSSANQTTNTPSLVYPVWNALEASATLSNGNLNARSTSNQIAAHATISVSSGKFYWEITAVNSNDQLFGITGEAVSYTNRLFAPFNYAPSVFFYGFGYFYQDGSTFTYDSPISAGDIIGIAVDFDAGKIWFAKNNTWLQSGDPENGTNPTTTFTVGKFTPSWSAGGPSGDRTGAADFGQLGFTYTPPTGFVSLNSANLTAPDYQGIDYFNATLYQGNGQNQRVGDFVPFTDTFTVSKSAMFDDGDRRYLARTYSASDPARSSNSQATISYWIKFCSNGANQDILTTSNSAQTLRLRHYINDQAGQQSIYMTLDGPSTNRDFEIPISKLSEQEWTNIVYNIDVDNSTAADKIKCWVNGVEQTSTDTSYQSASNADYFLFDNEEHFVGNLAPASAGYTTFCLNSYLAEMHVLDGQLKAPTDFGQVDTSTNRWIPKDYKTNVGTYGNRGFYMEFLNPTGTGNGVGTDSSGNGFNFTESFVSGGSAWTTSDQFIDTPSQNFDNLGGASSGSPTISEGHTLATIAAGGKQIRSNFNLNAGKWYVEVDIQATNNSASVGLVPSRSATFANGPGRDSNGGISYETDGDVYSDNVQNATAEASFAAGDVVQMAIDMDAKKVYFGKNNTFGGDPAAGTGGHFLPASILSDGAALITLGNYSGTQSSTQQINYGQFLNFDGGSTTNGFKYTPPTGFKAVNQDNLDDTASKITALAWIKNRDTTDNHMLANRVRGPQFITNSNSNSTGETTNVNAIQRFLKRGVQVGNDVNVNTANEAYVLWQWLMGDSATTGTTTSPAGSIASTTIVADAGHMSIGTFTGTGSNGTVGHGLSAAPEAFVVFNPTVAARFKMFYHKDSNASPASGYLHLESTESFRTDSTIYNNTVPTSTVFSVGTNLSINESGALNTFIAWRSVPGVCKVGSYTGNGNANGPYIDLGFKPAFFMAKQSSAVENWIMLDNQRPNYNPTGGYLFANLNNAEGGLGNEYVDFLSSGVKLRTTGASVNGSASFIYIAMADIGGNGTLPPIYGK